MTDSLWRKRQEPEALKLALEALTCCRDMVGHPDNLEYIDQKITAIKEALAQPEQSTPCGEPVAFYVQKALRRAYHLGQNYWADADSESYAANKRSDKHRQNFDELCEEALAYTTPPQRTWVGLTPQERDEINEQVYGAVPHHVAFHHAIEAKLKEKNT